LGRIFIPRSWIVLFDARALLTRAGLSESVYSSRSRGINRLPGGLQF
jgi:hypothetical protein